MRVSCLIGLTVALGVMGSEAAAQPAVLKGGEVLAMFQEAAAMALSPAGDLFVADAGRNVVEQLTGEGVPVRTIGGPGAREGQFDRPSGIDPTNGLVLLVADAGNGRIQRFGRDLLHLGSLTVGGFEAQAGNALRASGRGALTGFPEEAGGAPVAVASGPAGETYAVDESRGVVLKWDAAHRPERLIGDYGSGGGALVEPIDIALDGASNLYVADRGREAVLVYDAYGNYVRSLADGHAPGIRAVAVYGDGIWAVLPEQLREYDARGSLVRVIDVDLSEPLVDMAIGVGGVYLLTSTRLYSAWD